jgi:endonuclease/exonuclease/phosphatase family metal-dependent hydrolase
MRLVPAPVGIRLITHNIRYATESHFKGEEPWPTRCPPLCSQLVFNSRGPEAFICLQEVLHHQLMDVLSSLNEAATHEAKWAYIGVGRDDGKKAGEYSPIFYRPSIWHLNNWETRWMSETPNVPSKGWDAGCLRILTIGEFSHFKTGQKIVVMSTHLDNTGVRARQESAKIILAEVRRLNNVVHPSATLLAGDFNSTPNDGAYQIMTSPDSPMEDLGLQIPQIKRYGNELTYTSFGHVDNEPCRIDFIFSRKGDELKYETYGVLANRFDDGVYLSDHRACVADLQLLPS